MISSSPSRPSSEYLTFAERNSSSGKTTVVTIFSAHTGHVLGEIKWFGRWRRYAFYPEPGTIWDVGCLETINEYVDALMESRKAMVSV